mmetsp:Transcript_74318/g.177067  ORF Transcript_74318/g.177067 Transcript_74318/m.177067 type:complete len:667 (+) Transcript_74318:190-2190(+)
MAAAGGGGVPQFASLYVGDLHPDVTEAMLYEIFNSVGPVASIRVCRDSVTRRSLGYAYVNFHQVSDAERALDTLNYSSIKGRSCRIMWSQRDPHLRKSGAGNVFVKNLDTCIDNKALYDTFSLFGNILSCKVATDANGKSRGYGFVHYETEEAAKQAIEKVIGMQIGEKIVYVSQFLKRSERPKPKITNYKNLYIKNFPQDWDDAKLKEAFSEYGTITSSAAMTDKKGRKFAFVNYETSEAALAAVEAMHGKDMRSDEDKENKVGEDEEVGPDGPTYLLYCQRAQPKSERQAELKDKFGTEEKTTTQSTRQSGVNLYVKNLDENTDDASLRALFEPFGTITSVAAMKDDRDKCKGFGFVCFASPDEATKAVTEMHLKVVKGKPLYVGLAEKREARQERLRQRYSPSVGGPPGAKGGKGGGKKGGGAKVVVEPHRLEGVFLSKGKDDALCTRNMVPGESVYGEKRLVAEAAEGEEKVEYRMWNPFRSKLGAGIAGGIGNCPIKPGSKVLYLGGASGTTVSHVSDMIGPEGVVYAVEFSHRSGRDLTNMAKKRPNVVPIVEDARQPQRYRMLIGMVDVIFSDVAQPDQARIVTHNANFFLKNGGWVVISIKANCVDSTAAPEAVFAMEVDKLRKDGCKPKEQLTLEPYHRDHALVTAVYRASKKKKDE